MKVIIFTEGGAEIGFGHLTRCLALRDGLDAKGVDASFVVCADESVRSLLKDVDHKIIDWHKEFNFTDDMLKDFDYTVVDSYLATRKVCDDISAIMGPRAMFIDDYSRIEYPSATVVNPSASVEHLKYLEDSDINYLLGKDYIILRKEFWTEGNFSVKEKVKKVLVTLGGTVKDDLLKGIVSVLSDKAVVDVLQPTEKYFTASEVRQKMLSCDVCVSAGGQTLYELARLKVPSVVVGLAENQLGNIKALSELGAIEFVGFSNDAGIEDKVSNGVAKLASPSVRQEMSDKAGIIVDGLGVKRLVDEIINGVATSDR